jgi:predicted metal-dependent hydrolase
MDEDPPSVDAALLAGAALFNEGHVLAAHDPWEAAWLPLDSDGVEQRPGAVGDERLLHGLIAAAAATHHARSGNWSGAVGCAENAVEYLDAIVPNHRGVDVGPVTRWCRRLAADPETIERAGPPPLRINGVAPEFGDLDLDAALLAAPALAGSVDTATEATFERAAVLAREERGTGRTTFAELLFAFCREPETRPQVAARLADRVELADRKRRDVDDLF